MMLTTHVFIFCVFSFFVCSPNKNTRVEAAADAWGLRVAVGYAIVGDQLLFRHWFCRNGGRLDILSIDGIDIQTSGSCEHRGIDSINLNSNTMAGVEEWLGLALDAAGTVTGVAGLSKSSASLAGSFSDWSMCSQSQECTNGCCSGEYSDGVLKCTPLDNGYDPNICVGGQRYLRGVGSFEVKDVVDVVDSLEAEARTGVL